MFEGQLLEIYIAERRRGEPQRVEEVTAVAGHGLLGDRFYHEKGMGSPRHEVTLVESEAIDALARDCGIELRPGQSRRNLVTAGVPLNDLVGQKFVIGSVILRGIMLCEPCRHLEKITNLTGIKAALRGRGGLRAEILCGGTLHTGDSVRVLAAEAELLSE